uniref:Uncharacterized protein n=1 Tax=Physcomitrium patens TaxID=3218 RepID=A0A2K1K6C8_PHYPA|nr:hypothetical protein PHYPA_011229 [Physcomitrium patens]
MAHRQVDGARDSPNCSKRMSVCSSSTWCSQTGAFSNAVEVGFSPFVVMHHFRFRGSSHQVAFDWRRSEQARLDKKLKNRT